MKNMGGWGKWGWALALLIERKGNNEKKGNNNQVIHCCYCFLDTKEERGEQDCRGEALGNKHKPKLKPQKCTKIVKRVYSPE